MEKFEIVVAKSEIKVVGNRYLYGNNFNPLTKGDMIEAFFRKTLNPTDDKWYIKNSDAYDVASDIETANGDKISVKSGQFSLTEKLYSTEYTENEKRRLIVEYAKTVPSDKVAYGWVESLNESEYCINIVVVSMNTFIEFLKNNAVMTLIDTKTKRYKIKVKKSVSTVIREFTRIESENEGG